MVQAKKKIALLHRYPEYQIKETNAAFPYLAYDWTPSMDFSPGVLNYYPKPRMDVLTFKTFDRLGSFNKFWKSILWIFYAPLLVFGKGYDVIYCDDSYPFYPTLVKLVSPRSKLVLRIGDFHLMYYYSGLAYKILHFFEKISWYLADEILAISGDMAALMNYEIKKRVRVVLDPVDPQDFRVSCPKNRSFFGSVMFHGVLTKNKNVDILIKAAKLLPNIWFVIIGDGPERNHLKEIAPANVVFAGWLPFEMICEAIQACSIGIALRSDNPGNDFVVTSPFLQYGVMGKPCLVTKRKVFRNYEWQFSNVEEMVEKIKLLLNRPEEGQKLRRYILKHHDAKTIAEKIWSVLSF